MTLASSATVVDLDAYRRHREARLAAHGPVVQPRPSVMWCRVWVFMPFGHASAEG